MRQALLLLLLTVGLIGCSTSETTINPGGGEQILLNTVSVNLSPGSTHQFIATINRGTVPNLFEWSVIGGPSNGTISAEGLYTAPATTGRYRISCGSVEDPSVQAIAEIEVKSGVNINISPQNSTTTIGNIQQFTATVTGTTNTQVRFNVPGVGTAGSIDETGTYTAPNEPGTYEVQAISQADQTIIAKTKITVIPGIAMRLVHPTETLRAIYGSKLKMRAVVSGAADTTINWSILEGAAGGTIDSAGTFIAGTTEGYFTIVARANADSNVSKSYRVLVAPSARVQVETSQGTFILALRPDKAPNHCKNFVSLINDKFYDGIFFHRYEPAFVIQGGDPLTKTLPLSDPSIGTGGSDETVNLEISDLTHQANSLGMARGDDVNSASSQWYITLTRQASLDTQYTVFGNVYSGFGVVDQLRRGDQIIKMTTIP